MVFPMITANAFWLVAIAFILLVLATFLEGLEAGLLATLRGLLIFLLASLDNLYRGQYSVDPDAFVLVYEQLMKK